MPDLADFIEKVTHIILPGIVAIAIIFALILPYIDDPIWQVVLSILTVIISYLGIQKLIEAVVSFFEKLS